MNELVPTATDKYVLSDVAKKLIEVKVSPVNYGKSVTDICQIADISRDSYYRLMRDKEFVKILNETGLELIKSHVIDIIGSTVKFALKDAKCHSDRRMLLEMINMYRPQQTVDVNGGVNLSFEQLLKQALSENDTTENE